MDYFKNQLALVKTEREEDLRSFQQQTLTTTASERRANGMAWYPVAICATEIGRGEYLTVEFERTTHHNLAHQFRSGMPVALFSNHAPQTDRLQGTLSFIYGNKLKISFRVDELPDWTRDGKLGIDLLFDSNSYDEMQAALNTASTRHALPVEGALLRVLTAEKSPEFSLISNENAEATTLNEFQQIAVQKILAAKELAIVHGPPGTGKTTTLVAAIRALLRQNPLPVLVVAPSNTAVDLLSEKLAAAGLNVLRVGNPARVADQLLALTLEHKLAEHPSAKEMKRLKKQAAEFKNLAHTYKRNFGKAERDQRNALFDESRKLMKEVGKLEQYAIEDTVSKTQVIAATLVGSNHYTVRGASYQAVVMDEAGQALEPACWIPVLKAPKLIMAGDHCQLPPTVKSAEAAAQGLTTTLLEKCVAAHPEAVVLLREQYRMHELIMGYSSQIFYENKLMAHPSVARHTVHSDEAPLVFIDTAGCGFEEKSEGTSYANPEEAAFLFKHLVSFISQLSTQEVYTVGVVSPYRQQVLLMQELQKHLTLTQELNQTITVNTIDSFQGQERDIVYISLTRSNDEGTIGFLNDIRRMNVAMTRARKKLVVIGDSATIARLPFYADFISYAEQAGGYHSAWEFMHE
ncbi:AAA domain-containing protein [Arundinibacter roseus]|uniref:DUF2075 domain-containing protein n=1 Tax=Arundinibacter roseus TaxID=2070510 RepID=A0A4V2X901_9BACT|nr:AAA domain-containing protein [Arundinibacter roseus]TDB61885.1 DUF2075 domain-containing protein [Arundinibacter roseus]